MSLKVEKLEKNMAKLTIEASAEDFAKAVKEAYNKNKNKMSVPGFRKGKVPQAMIEKVYGPEVFYDDAANIIIPDAYEKELTENKDLSVVSRPEITVVQCEKGKSFIFEAMVALKPEVELGKYKGVEVEAVDTEVTDADVDAEIAKEQERNSRTITVEGRPVKEGDTAVIDFEGFVDGVAFEGGKGDNYPLVIGSGSFIPGFEEQIIGANTGDSLDVNVTFPEDYQADNLAGKAAVFKVTVNEIKEKEVPALDDDFAAEVSEFDTMDEYKADLKVKLATKKEEEAKAKKQDEVIAAIVAEAKMEIPDAMIDTQARTMANDYANRLQSQGLSLDQYFMFTGLDMDKFLEQMKPQALKRIQGSLVLEAVANAENFEISDEDYEAELQRMADSYKMSLDKIKEMIGDDEYAMKQIKDDLKVQKAINLVVDSAKEVKAKKSAKKAKDAE